MYRLLPFINLLPHILIIIVIFYFYTRKKLTGLIWMGFAYIVLTALTILSMYGAQYFQEQSMSMEEIKTIYEKIGMVSIIAQLVLVLGLVLVLNKYPDADTNGKSDFI